MDEMWQQDLDLLEALESEARYNEFSEVLGVLKMCQAQQQSEERLIKILCEQKKWAPNTVRRVLAQLQEVGWVKLFDFKVVKMIPIENRKKAD
jgi:hypothetical protein